MNLLALLRALFHRENVVSEATLRHVNEIHDKREHLAEMESKGWRKTKPAVVAAIGPRTLARTWDGK